MCTTPFCKIYLISLIPDLVTQSAGHPAPEKPHCSLFYRASTAPADLATLDLNFYRAKTIGVIFQNYNLLSHLNAAENVQLALRLASVPSSLEAALALLAEVGIGRETATRSVTALSGGEQQRVAIARALAGNPHIILADEPTGNLDQENQQTILNIFLSLAHEQGKCVIIASHASELVQSADYVLELYTQRHK